MRRLRCDSGATAVEYSLLLAFIFATAFFTHLHATGDLGESARFANCVAASSVTRVGLASTPAREEVDRCRRILAR